MKFYGKKILVIGGSSGIGKSTAIELARRGASLIVIGSNQEHVDETINLIKSRFPDCEHFGYKFNLADPNSLSLLISKLDKIDGLVYSAGIQKVSPLQFITNEDFHEVQYLNSYMPLFIVREVVKLKIISKGSSIVFISSISGTRVGSKGLISYSASKSALLGTAKCLALELSKLRIRVNSVLPGMIKDTRLNNTDSFSVEQIENDKKRYPLGDYGTCEDVSNAILFLLSDLSRYITGTEIVIDGGFSLN
jgi:NAD(P)-dependent dehydrogenase (short-subunit alcohol dehydrogenase family)